MLPLLQQNRHQAIVHWWLVQTNSHCQQVAMHHSFDMCDECHRTSINVDLQTQNSTDDLLVLCTCTLSLVPAYEESDHLALELQLAVEKLDHSVSSLRISSVFQQHDVSCESTGCQDMTETCSECIYRMSSEPHSVHGSCGCLTASDDRWLVAESVEHRIGAAVNPVLPGTVPDSPGGHTKCLMPRHLQYYHHRLRHLHMALKMLQHNICR